MKVCKSSLHSWHASSVLRRKSICVVALCLGVRWTRFPIPLATIVLCLPGLPRLLEKTSDFDPARVRFIDVGPSAGIQLIRLQLIFIIGTIESQFLNTQLRMLTPRFVLHDWLLWLPSDVTLLPNLPRLNTYQAASHPTVCNVVFSGLARMRPPP